jgi:hypothetical protein
MVPIGTSVSGAYGSVLATTPIVNVAVAIILLVHGIAHLPGCVGRWRPKENFPYQTTILGGRIEVGRVGGLVVGGLWLLLAIYFALVAWAAFTGASWWPSGVVQVAFGSLLLCLVDWPEAKIGVAVDVALILIVVGWHAGLGVIRLG